MQGIYNYIPETKHVSKVYSFTTIPSFQSMLHVMLFPMLNAATATAAAAVVVVFNARQWSKPTKRMIPNVLYYRQNCIHLPSKGC
jgi:hypothetical protein